MAFAHEHGMKVRGHTLVWHRQTPAWVFQDSSGAKASPELLLARMKNHIAHVVTHFKGSVYAWDVVNEAILDNGEYRTDHEAGTQTRRDHSAPGMASVSSAAIVRAKVVTASSIGTPCTTSAMTSVGACATTSASALSAFHSIAAPTRLAASAIGMIRRDQRSA